MLYFNGAGHPSWVSRTHLSLPPLEVHFLINRTLRLCISLCTGDTGATFLGFILSTMSIQGLFKFYAVISFAVPFLILGLPIFDTAFAMIRRMAHGQSPMHADRGHIHHRLIDMGLNQKQAVATLYVISGILGLSAVVLTTGGEAKAMLLLIALCVVAVVAARVVFPKEVKEELHEELEELTELGHHEEKDKQKEDGSHE